MDRNEQDFFKQIKKMDMRVRILERGGAGGGDAGSTDVDTTNFNGVLGVADDTVQKALDKIDDFNGSVQVFGGTLGGELTGIKTITTTHITAGLTNNGNRITISEAGKYFVHAQQLVSTGASAAIYFHIRKNGVTQVYGYINASTSTTDAIADIALDCVAGDYIDIYIQNSCTSVWGSTHSNLSIFKITQGKKGDKGLQWQGAWGSAVAYSIDDMVAHNGATYVCKVANTGVQPPNSAYWDIFVTGNQSLVPFMHLGMSGAQTVDNGSVVAFNTVRKSNGLTNASNGINLKAGKTYRLMAWVNFSGGTGNAYLGYNFYGNGVAFGSNAYSDAPVSPTGYGFKAPLVEYITPTVDTLVDVRITDDAIGTGVLQASWNSSFIAEEIVAGEKGDKGDAGDLNIDTTTGKLNINGDCELPAGKKFLVDGENAFPKTFIEYDTTARTFTTTLADGKTWATRTIRDGFDVELDIELPVRNDSASWGGGYCEIQISVNGGAFVSLGTSGFHLAMNDAANWIGVYKKGLALSRAEIGAPATGDFTVAFKLRHKSYDATLQINTNDGTASTKFKSQAIIREIILG